MFHGNILNTRCVELTMTIPTTPTHTPTSSQLSQGFHKVSVWRALPRQTLSVPRTYRGHATSLCLAGVSNKGGVTGGRGRGDQGFCHSALTLKQTEALMSLAQRTAPEMLGIPGIFS